MTAVRAASAAMPGGRPRLRAVLKAWREQEGAADGRRLRWLDARQVREVSADTSVPEQWEAGLDSSQSRLPDAVLRDSPAGVAFIGVDLRFAWVNPALARMYGRDVADFPGRAPAEVWPPLDATRAEAALQRVLAEGRPATETFAVGAADPGLPPGTPRVLHWFPVRDDSGLVIGAGLIIAGLTAPSPSEEALRRSEERYRALVQGGAQVIWVASPDGVMVEDAPDWRMITGQTEEEFFADGWLQPVHADDRERVERDWRDSLRTGRIFEDRFRTRTRGGGYRHYDVRAVPIERDGKIAEWVGACTDVTSQR